MCNSREVSRTLKFAFSLKILAKPGNIQLSFLCGLKGHGKQKTKPKACPTRGFEQENPPQQLSPSPTTRRDCGNPALSREETLSLEFGTTSWINAGLQLEFLITGWSKIFQAENIMQIVLNW